MGMPWAEAAKGEVARRLGAKEDNGEGDAGGGCKVKGEGALRCMLGLGGEKPDPVDVRLKGNGDDWESWCCGDALC